MPSKIKTELCKQNLEKLNISEANSPMTGQKNNYGDLDIGASTPQMRYEKKFNEIVPDYETLNQEELQFLKDAYKAMKQLDKCLNSLNSVGLNFTIGLAGGAVRDWTIGTTQKVKDFDIYLSIASTSLVSAGHEPKVLPSFTQGQLSELLSPDTMIQFNSLFAFDSNENATGSRYEILDVVLKEMLTKTFCIDEHYASQNIEAQYLQNGIASNFKLTLPGLAKKS